jgi:hypothetical protein
VISVANELMFTLANVVAHFQHKSFYFSDPGNAALRRFSSSIPPKVRHDLRYEDDGKGDGRYYRIGRGHQIQSGK